MRGRPRIRTPEENKERQRVYYASWYSKNKQLHNARKNREHERRWHRENPEARRAHKVLNLALASGEVKKPLICQVCGETKRLIAHHDDYRKPLEVRFICYRCHKLLHYELKRKKLFTSA